MSVFDEARYDEIWFVGGLQWWAGIMHKFSEAKNVAWFTGNDDEFEYHDGSGMFAARMTSEGKMALHRRAA